MCVLDPRRSDQPWPGAISTATASATWLLGLLGLGRLLTSALAKELSSLHSALKGGAVSEGSLAFSRASHWMTQVGAQVRTATCSARRSREGILTGTKSRIWRSAFPTGRSPAPTRRAAALLRMPG